MNATTTQDIWSVGTVVEIFTVKNGNVVVLKTEKIVGRTAKRFTVKGAKFIPETNGMPVAQQACDFNPSYARPAK